MILRIANPIYDSVFKYLVEDLRIAKILISALLKKEVLEVEVRKHEYTNGTRDNISMFRIDFGAKVRESDGSQHLVLIELQKTWLETETLRFRQYLGAQYANFFGIVHNEREGVAARVGWRIIGTSAYKHLSVVVCSTCRYVARRVSHGNDGATKVGALVIPTATIAISFLFRSDINLF